MNTWKKPEIMTLDIEATKGGGTTISTHDGEIYNINGVWVEEYHPES